MTKKRKKKVNPDDYIIKDSSIKIWESNTLAVAPTESILHPNVLKLFMWTMYETIKFYNRNLKNKNLSDGETVEIDYSINDFARFFGIQKSNIWNFLKTWSSEIQTYRYYLMDENTSKLEGVVIFPYFLYDHKTGNFLVHLNTKINKHLFNLKAHKTSLELDILRQFNNPRFIKMCEYFKAKVYEGQKNRIVNITLENLKKLLVVSDEKYQRFNDFKIRILAPILKDFKKYKPMDVKMETVRTGRFITSCRFTVSNYGVNGNFVKPETGFDKQIVDITKNNVQVNVPTKKSNVNITNEPIDIYEGFENIFNEQHNKSNNKSIQSGFQKLDVLNGGFKRGSINIIASDTGVGKTCFLSNILQNIKFSQQKINSLMISLEMKTSDLLMRNITSLLKINADQISNLDPSELKTKLQKIVQTTNQSYIQYHGGSTLKTIVKTIKQCHNNNDVSLIAIDYLQQIEVENNRLAEHEKFKKIVQTLQQVANELKITIIAISQVNRETMKNVEKRQNNITKNSLYGSSSLNQASDLILILHEMFNNTVCVEVAKNRHGQTGKVDFMFRKQWMSFEEM